MKAWLHGADTRQRRKALTSASSPVLEHQRLILLEHLQGRQCGFSRKRKLLTHARNLFAWLDLRGLPVDSPNVIAWAGDGVRRDTANYADRLFIARAAVELSGQPWVLPKHRRPKGPKVSRPFVETASDSDVMELLEAIQDPQAAAFARVVAATGCRPSEVVYFDWARWEREGRPQALHGWSPKVRRPFVAAIHPRQWLEGLNTCLLYTSDAADE